MFTHLRPAVVMLALFTALTGLAYPLAMTGLIQIAMPRQANGSVVQRNGVTVGSALIGQAFATDRYFHGRPSATSTPDPKDDTKTIDLAYNAASSSGSNLGPLSKKLIDRVNGDVAEFRRAGAGQIPADAVTTSASGLDPHISPTTAALQVQRIAVARGVSEQQVSAILERQTEMPFLGLFGERRVNVLQLNLALDAILPKVAG
jgi:potassium-transporting ATPase KdpC subunit